MRNNAKSHKLRNWPTLAIATVGLSSCLGLASSLEKLSHKDSNPDLMSTVRRIRKRGMKPIGAKTEAENPKSDLSEKLANLKTDFGQFVIARRTNALRDQFILENSWSVGFDGKTILPKLETNLIDMDLVKRIEGLKNNLTKCLILTEMTTKNEHFFHFPQLSCDILRLVPAFRELLFTLPWPIDKLLRKLSINDKAPCPEFQFGDAFKALHEERPLVEMDLIVLEILPTHTNYFTVSGGCFSSQINRLPARGNDFVVPADMNLKDLIEAEKKNYRISDDMIVVSAVGILKFSDIYVVSDVDCAGPSADGILKSSDIFVVSDVSCAGPFIESLPTSCFINQHDKIERESVQVRLLLANKDQALKLQVLKAERTRRLIKAPYRDLSQADDIRSLKNHLGITFSDSAE